ECGVWIGHAGNGTWGLRRAVVCQRAVGTGDVSNLYVWQRRAEEHLVTGYAEGRKAWLLRVDRTGIWIEPWGNEDPRPQSWQRICTQWREDVDHFGLDRGCRCGLGQSGE